MTTTLKVNGESVSPVSIEQERQQLLKDLSLQQNNLSNDKLKLMVWDRAKQNVIDHYLFKQEAEKRGIVIADERVEVQVDELAKSNGGLDKLKHYLSEINESIEDFRGHIKDRMLVDALVEQIHEQIGTPKDRAAKKFYKENKDLFNIPEKADVDHIVKRYRNLNEKRKAKQEIDKIEAALKAGKSFKLMVKQRSDNPTNDGRFGWVENGKLGVVFDNFIFSAEAGSISSPIETADGYYLIRVVEKEEAVQQKFEDVKDQIIHHLLQEERKSAMLEELSKLRETAVIEE